MYAPDNIHFIKAVFASLADAPNPLDTLTASAYTPAIKKRHIKSII
jgi:hypothetical protein